MFVPIISILIIDVFVFKSSNDDKKNGIYKLNFIVWIVGFVIYRIFLKYDISFVLGISFLDIISTGLIYCIVRYFHIRHLKKKNIK